MNGEWHLLSQRELGKHVEMTIWNKQICRSDNMKRKISRNDNMKWEKNIKAFKRVLLY